MISSKIPCQLCTEATIGIHTAQFGLVNVGDCALAAHFAHLVRLDLKMSILPDANDVVPKYTSWTNLQFKFGCLVGLLVGSLGSFHNLLR